MCFIPSSVVLHRVLSLSSSQRKFPFISWIRNTESHFHLFSQHCVWKAWIKPPQGLFFLRKAHTSPSFFHKIFNLLRAQLLFFWICKVLIICFIPWELLLSLSLEGPAAHTNQFQYISNLLCRNHYARWWEFKERRHDTCYLWEAYRQLGKTRHKNFKEHITYKFTELLEFRISSFHTSSGTFVFLLLQIN